MVFTEINQGFGNQLFQYAAARALSVRLSTALKLDTTWFEYVGQRAYQLNFLNIAATPANRFEQKVLDILKRERRGAKAMKMLRRLHFPGAVAYLVDRERGFAPALLSVRGNVFLKGYWQSERYFQAIAPILREEFTFKAAPDAANQAMLRQIDSCESIVLHVRRGDYVTTTHAQGVYGVCPPDYYASGIEHLRQRLKDPHAFIFSDDPGWVADHLKLAIPSTLVTHNTGKQDHEDLRLMSRGKHFIIANSSFSWWGAWLGAHPGKQIIAPRQWFQDSPISTEDLVPPTWTRM
jgi:hypothetical protein